MSSNDNMYPDQKDPESQMKPMEFQTASALRPPPPPNAPPPAPPVALVGGYIEKENGHSMPSLEEARTTGAIHQGGAYNRYSGKHKRAAVLVALAVLAVLAVALVTGLTVALGRRQNQTVSNASQRDPDGDADGTDDGLDIPRLQAVTQLLSLDITEAATFNDVTSPQYRAARWIADEDAFEMEIPQDPDDFEGAYYFIQRYVMAVFFYALDGENWEDDLGFLSGDNICDWYVELDPSTVPDDTDPDTWDLGVVCDDEDEVLRIFIANNGLSGSLPSELGKLITLDHLSLYRNKIQGSIPDTMQNLVDLTFVNLENNALMGSLPAWLNKWASLEVLGLGDNGFSGQLPVFTGMEYLTQLALDNNELSGTVDNVAAATSLQVLFLENNTFTGTINDDFLLVGLEDLRLLDLGDNQFVGSFPAYFYSLEVIDLSNNKLTGSMAPVPDDDSIELNLWYLSVYNNEMKGGLPTGLRSLELEHLDVAKNQMTGSLEELDGSKGFRQLYLSQNDFDEGPIPGLSGCTELEVLSMSDTKRNGDIDSWVGNLGELLVLDLHNNELAGPIPSELAELVNLEVLLLQRNKLTGPIPPELGNLANDERTVKIFLDNNDLTGTADDMADLCDNTGDETFAMFSIDDTIESCECCTTFCPVSDVDCTKQTELEKRDFDIKDGSDEAVVSENLNINVDEDDDNVDEDYR